MNRRGQSCLMLAAVVGSLHAASSLYWSLGGDWLLNTLGARIVSAVEPFRWVLLPIGLAKLIAAWVPLTQLTQRKRARWVMYLGAACLVLWGGINTVIGQLVLWGIVVPDGGYDREGMIGHAYLWDPLFLVWGISLWVGLATIRARTRGAQA